MDIIIAIIVVVWVIYADKKRKAKKAQENAGMNRQSVGRVNWQSAVGMNRQSVGRINQPGQAGNMLHNAADVMEKSMSQTQRELKERLQKKYGSVAQQGRAVSQSNMQRGAGIPQPDTQRGAGNPQSNVQNRRMQQPEEENSIISRAAANVQEEAVYELRFEQMEETVVDSLDLALIESSPLMQQISDLMITGYTGELSFGRDFVAEGVEMLNRCEMMEF